MIENHTIDTVKKLFIFFSPAYPAGVIFLLTYIYGFVGVFTFISFIIYGIIAIVIALSLHEYFPNAFGYIGRNLFHMIGGIFIIIGNIFFIEYNALIIGLFCLFTMFITGWNMELLGVETLVSKHRIIKKLEDYRKSSHYEAGTFWLLAVMIVLMFFRINIAYAAIAILSIGDTAASIVGRNNGKISNPLNKNKSVEGSVAFFVTSIFASMLFIPTETAIIVSLICALVEALSTEINDNFTIPISAALLMELMI